MVKANFENRQYGEYYWAVSRLKEVSELFDEEFMIERYV